MIWENRREECAYVHTVYRTAIGRRLSAAASVDFAGSSSIFSLGERRISERMIISEEYE